MITRLVWTIWTPMFSVPKKADKLNLSLSVPPHACTQPPLVGVTHCQCHTAVPEPLVCHLPYSKTPIDLNEHKARLCNNHVTLVPQGQKTMLSGKTNAPHFMARVKHSRFPYSVPLPRMYFRLLPDNGCFKKVSPFAMFYYTFCGYGRKNDSIFSIAVRLIRLHMHGVK